MDTLAATQRLPIWEEKQTEHFVFFFEPSSYAARTIDQTASRAESAYRRGWEWFGGDSPPPTITLYLASWLHDTARPGWASLAGGQVVIWRNVVWMLVTPEAPAVGLERAVLHVLVRAAPGSVPRHADGLLRALAGLIASEHGFGLSADEADRSAHERHVLGKAPPDLFAAEDEGSAHGADPAEVSFLAFLERTYGRTAQARFAQASLTGEPAAAADTAYSRPLRALEQDWLATLRARRRAAAAGQDVLRWALPLLRPHWGRVVELLGYMLFNLAFGIAIPLSAKYLFDEIIAPRSLGLVWIWFVAVLAIFAVGSLVAHRRMVVGGLIGELVLRDLRRTAFAQLQWLSQRFYTRSSTGDLLSRMTNDMDAVRAALGETLPVLLFQLISLIVGAIVLLLLNWQLGLLVLLLGAPVFGFVYIRASQHLRRASRERQDRIGEMTTFIQENLSGQTVVKSFSLEQRAIGRFEDLLGRVFQGSMRMHRISGLLYASSTMTWLGIRAAVLAAGAVLVLNETMTVGELVAFVEMTAQVLSPIAALGGLFQQLQSATGSLDRIQEILGEVPDVAEDPLAIDLPDLKRAIRFEQVSFRYGEGEAGLRDVTLTIPAGQRAAIVGPSGAGKSTLIGLLLRMYDPDEGRVLFDGRDIREGTLASVRRQQALVPQDTFLFNTTIGENIAFAREAASDDQVVAAAKAAAVHEVITRTEKGYQTEVGERGVRLSGGQRQRLSIARALLRDPRLLILDEATSALDPATEAAIVQTLQAMGHGRTTVAITHRLSSVTDYDRIFVLDQGRLVEQGTHQELCELQGLYARLYNEQQAGVLEALPLPIEPRRLARVPLFASLTLAELAAVAMRVYVERYPAGTVIVRQGEPADKLFVIGDGEVEVLVEDRRGDPRRVKVLGARSYFGEVALLGDDSARRTAMVRTLTPVELYSLHKEDFIGLLKAHPTLAKDVSRLARMRLEQARDMVGAGGEPAGPADSATTRIERVGTPDDPNGF